MVFTTVDNAGLTDVSSNGRIKRGKVPQVLGKTCGEHNHHRLNSVPIAVLPAYLSAHRRDGWTALRCKHNRPSPEAER